MSIDNVIVNFSPPRLFAVRCVIREHQTFLTQNPQAQQRVCVTVHVQREMSANYDNASQLGEVSMETELQRFCLYALRIS